jgi:hypothetical protein
MHIRIEEAIFSNVMLCPNSAFNVVIDRGFFRRVKYFQLKEVAERTLVSPIL